MLSTHMSQIGTKSREGYGQKMNTLWCGSVFNEILLLPTRSDFSEETPPVL